MTKNKLIDLNDWSTRRGSFLLQPPRHRARHRIDALRHGRFRALQRHRLARIAADADSRIDFNLDRKSVV